MSTQESQPTARHAAPTRRPRKIPAPVMWFAVLGGVVAWSLQILVTWSVMEVTCITPISTDLVDQHGGSPSAAAWTVAIAGMAVPWVVAVLAFLTGLWVHRRLRSYQDEEPSPDVLAGSRTSFLIVLGHFLNLLSVAIITASAVALWGLEPCG